MRIATLRSGLRVPLQAAGAVAVGTTAFILTRERYTCTLPTGREFFVFAGLGVVFMLAFVWLITGVLSALARRVGGRAQKGLAFGVALLLYAVIAAIAWLYNPTPHDMSADASARAVLSVFWSAGFLQESGHFSNYSCGY